MTRAKLLLWIWMQSYMAGKPVILLTGATGTIGHALTKQLLALGYEIIAVVRNLQKSHQIFSERVIHVAFDGENFSPSLVGLSVDIVIHLASYSTSRNDKEAIINLINSNVLFVSLLLKELEKSNLKLFVNAGSFSEFHLNTDLIDPTYFYSATKTASRFMIDYFSKIYGFIFVNSILYSVYGREAKSKKIIDYMIEAIDASAPVAMSDGYQILDFIHIDDVIRFYLLLIEHYPSLSDSYHEYHIGTGNGTSLRELAYLFGKITGIQPNILWNANQTRKRDTLKAIADTQSAFDELGWKADVSLELGIQKYLNDYGKEHAKYF